MIYYHLLINENSQKISTHKLFTISKNKNK